MEGERSYRRGRRGSYLMVIYLDRDLVDAAKKGKLKRLDQATLKASLAASKSRMISIRLPESDIELARLQADARGLPYQTYIKSVLHQALRQVK